MLRPTSTVPAWTVLAGTVLTSTMLAGTVLLWTAPAVAQVGLGAERYEVTITPPKRPGSEPADAAAATATPVPDPNTVLGAIEEGAPRDGADPSRDDAPEPSGTQPSASGAGTGSDAATREKSGAVAPAPAATGAASEQVARAEANLPRRTFQVGAFRKRSSAQAMHDKLGASFQDVAIVEVQSGGEALYRVNVGRLPRGASLDDLRRRLVAAGYPAFEVPAPPPSAND